MEGREGGMEKGVNGWETGREEWKGEGGRNGRERERERGRNGEGKMEEREGGMEGIERNR